MPATGPSHHLLLELKPRWKKGCPSSTTDRSLWLWGTGYFSGAGNFSKVTWLVRKLLSPREFATPTGLIHLINPKTDSVTTRPLYMKRALYSPLAGLLAVAASIPRERYEVVLTDENIEPIDFDLKADLVGLSAMTSYVKRGYEIADRFRSKGVPVVMGGVHPSFMPSEALRHCDAVVIGEVELVIERLLDDLKAGRMRGTYKSDKLHPMVGMSMPRYDLLKRNRYVNSTFVQTSRGCHQGCTFRAEPLMNGLKFRYRPVDEVVREMEEWRLARRFDQ
jgi:hypothetical protein